MRCILVEEIKYTEFKDIQEDNTENISQSLDSKESETLIINVAGRLLILHRSEQVSFIILLYDIK